jgi:glycosyltransferase involved in cell wall biosynthesis
MVLLEAMADGVPFVASTVAGIPRLAADGGGLLVAPEDADGLTDALVRVLSDADLRRRAGAAGRAWWAANSDPAAVHSALQDGYPTRR